jgi:lipid II:glycine glycyltransferase (peptidoglycan interpeptide bridge formation enzyme)
VYPLGFFRRLYENRSGHEILWLAFKDEEPLCGALCFYWNRHAVYWHGASSARYFHLKPNNLLFWEIILDAMRKGHAVFDFNPSGGYAGVESFKERFGAERLPAPVITVRSPLRRMISGLRGGARDIVRLKKG